MSCIAIGAVHFLFALWMISHFQFFPSPRWRYSLTSINIGLLRTREGWDSTAATIRILTLDYYPPAQLGFFGSGSCSVTSFDFFSSALAARLASTLRFRSGANAL